MRKKVNEAVVSGEAWLSALEKVFHYLPLIAGFVGLTGIGTWFASGTAALAGQGWGAYALIGLGVACAVTLVASAGAVAWRYFKPLPAPVSVEITKASAKSPDAMGAMGLHLERLIDQSESTLKQTLSKTDRDVLILLNYAVYQSALLMLDDLLNAAPEDMHEGPLRLGGDFAFKNAASIDFVALVRRKMDPGSDRRARFESVMDQASHAAEQQVEQTPQEQRPTGIDPLALRKYVIAHLQCVRAIGFLEKEKREVEENLLNQRSNLLRQYQLRKA